MEALGDHLRARYGVSVARLSELDLGVFRVDTADGPAWVARVFPATRSLEDARGDAGILEALAMHGFPAERCAHPDPVSRLEAQGVLVTEFVPGLRAHGGRRSFTVLGELLGRLHARTGGPHSRLRAGGGWHHMTVQGSPRDEIAAAIARLEQARPQPGAPRRWHYDALQAALEQAEDCAGLPEALLHPDFVPANAIVSEEGRLVIVDWTGAGRGPRAWSLAFLLWAAGARELGLVDAVSARYASHVRLEPRELARLAAAIRVRPLVLDTWSVCMGRKPAAQAAGALAGTARLAEAIAARARHGLEGAGPEREASGP